MRELPTIIQSKIPTPTISKDVLKKLEKFLRPSSRKITKTDTLCFLPTSKGGTGKIIVQDTIILSTKLGSGIIFVHVKTLLSTSQSLVSTSLELSYMKKGLTMTTIADFPKGLL